MGWYVNWRVKGPDSPIGGYMRCDAKEELDEFLVQLNEREAGIYIVEIT